MKKNQFEHSFIYCKIKRDRVPLTSLMNSTLSILFVQLHCFHINFVSIQFIYSKNEKEKSFVSFHKIQK